jgi:hypothetical protein
MPEYPFTYGDELSRALEIWRRTMSQILAEPYLTKGDLLVGIFPVDRGASDPAPIGFYTEGCFAAMKGCLDEAPSAEELLLMAHAADAFVDSQVIHRQVGDVILATLLVPVELPSHNRPWTPDGHHDKYMTLVVTGLSVIEQCDHLAIQFSELYVAEHVRLAQEQLKREM